MEKQIKLKADDGKVIYGLLNQSPRKSEKLIVLFTALGMIDIITFTSIPPGFSQSIM